MRIICGLILIHVGHQTTTIDPSRGDKQVKSRRDSQTGGRICECKGSCVEKRLRERFVRAAQISGQLRGATCALGSTVIVGGVYNFGAR